MDDAPWLGSILSQMVGHGFDLRARGAMQDFRTDKLGHVGGFCGAGLFRNC